MKYLVSLFLGVLVGASLTALLVYYNPLGVDDDLSPLAVTDKPVITLNYAAVPAESLLYTNNGESRVVPTPPKVLQLWEAPVRRTAVMVSLLTDTLGDASGIGVKFSSDSEDSSLLDTAALVDSIWLIYLPGRGSLFIEQSENYWSYIRGVVVPAYLSSGDSWKGTWRGVLTVGPHALGTSRVLGGSGKFDGMETEGIETLDARAWSADRGPVSMDGQLVLELPAGVSAVAVSGEPGD